jgi:hypothetical protein
MVRLSCLKNVNHQMLREYVMISASTMLASKKRKVFLALIL